MTLTNAKTKKSLLGLALGTLITTSLTGTAEAAWSSARCTAQCSSAFLAGKKAVGAGIRGKDKDKEKANNDYEKLLNECATNCDNTKIIDLLLENQEKLTLPNQKSALTAQLLIKKKEQVNIERKLRAELDKKKPSQPKIKALNAQQDQIISEINALENRISKIAPPRPASDAPSTPARSQNEAAKHHQSAFSSDVPPSHHIPPPPSESPPPPSHLSAPPSDLPPSHHIPPPPSESPSSPGEEKKHEAESVSGPVNANPKAPPPPPPPPPTSGTLKYKEKQKLLEQEQNASPRASMAPSKIQAPDGQSDRGGLLNDLNADNPRARLRRVDSNAPKPPAPSQGGGDWAEALKKAMVDRRRDVAGTLSKKDQAQLNKLVAEGKTPQQIQEMMDDDFSLFEDHILVEKELKRLGK